MSIHVIGIVGLVLIFVVGTLRPVNIGVLALVATLLLGTLVAGESLTKALAGFPPDLFVLLVGVTYLFGLASVNGTLEWLVERVERRLGDRVALVPWLLFVVAAVPTTAGALGPAGVAMLAPLCLRLGERYAIDRRLSALMVVLGSSAGNFSPLNGLAVIVRQAAVNNGLSVSAAGLYFGNLAVNVVLAVVAYLLFGGLALVRRGAPLEAGTTTDVADTGSTDLPTGGPGGAGAAGGGTSAAPALPVGTLERPPRTPLRVDQAITLVVIVAVAIGALVFDVDIGFLALAAAALLHLSFPQRVKGADLRIVWSVVLLICGVVTYVGALQRYGTVDVVGRGISGLGAPLLVAFLLCVVAAATSAFASSAGLLGVLIPLAAPFLASGRLGAGAVIVALAISATIVDATPFSSVGALTLANAPEEGRPRVFRALLGWGLSMIVIAPVVCWLVFVLPFG